MSQEVSRQELDAMVEKLLSRHRGGQEYFDALDAEIREGRFFPLLTDYIRDNFPGYNRLVLSGRFGHGYAGWLFDNGYHKTRFKRPLILPGNLRHWDHPTIARAIDKDTWWLDGASFLFVDDSLYAGRTYRVVQEFVESHGGFLYCGVVIYDGSPEPVPGIRSLYRYHDG